MEDGLGRGLTYFRFASVLVRMEIHRGDVDECSEADVCSRGRCYNTDGSFQCLCEAGFTFSPTTADCEDKDECKDFGSSVCGTWRCENTVGSYRCFMGCQPGLEDEGMGSCDEDECASNETICGEHGFCENTDGSYRCQCDQGYTNPSRVPGCVDINECEMSTALCGSALCENVEGSFLCICSSDNEEFDPISSQCRSRTLMMERERAPPFSSSAPSDGQERKECYYNLDDAHFCDNALSRNATKQECCCTVGASWGDNCEIHPCPLPGRAEYNQLCPHGNGLLPLTVPSQGFPQQLFKDLDECEMFGSEICKNGQCSNTYSSYSCFCPVGFYYHTVRLECVDHDECQTEDTCGGSMCVNTPGSFICFCSPPLILDSTGRRCVNVNVTEEIQAPFSHICWQTLTSDNMCVQPLLSHRTTYTECCCVSGVAWGDQCAFCPRRTSEEYAQLCNLPRRLSEGTDSLRERPGYEYGPDGPDGPLYWGGYGSTGGRSYYGNSEYSPRGDPPFNSLDPDDYGSQEVVREPVHRPREFRPRLVNPYSDRYDGFEGLRAEECGILNGCENGRCVRVREGYTCDCFDGFQLDLTKMACIDINECEDISDKVPLCRNGACSNTDGSYKCTCLPGFLATAKPHECFPGDSELAQSEAGK